MAAYHVSVIIEIPDENDRRRERRRAGHAGSGCRTHVADSEPHGLAAMIAAIYRNALMDDAVKRVREQRKQESQRKKSVGRDKRLRKIFAGEKTKRPLQGWPT